MIADYSELVQAAVASCKAIDKLTTCPANDDHSRIGEEALHLLKIAAEINAVAKINAELG